MSKVRGIRIPFSGVMWKLVTESATRAGIPWYGSPYRRDYIVLIHPIGFGGNVYIGSCTEESTNCVDSIEVTQLQFFKTLESGL